MKILQTPPRLYPYTGGVESVVLALSRALVNLGHDVTVVCADEPRGAPRRVDGVPVKRLGYPLKLANTNITLALPWQLARQPFDVVHTHLPTPWAADWSAALGRARGKGVVLTYYNEIVGRGAAGSAAGAYNRVCLPVALRLAHRIVINSLEIMQRPGSPLQAVEDKVRLLPCGVDTSRFSPNPDLRVPGTVGFLAILDEFHRYKALDVLLRAAQQLIEMGRNIRLLIGGEGKLRPEYEQLAADLGLGSRAEFRGFVPEDDLVDFFNSCEVFGLPTIDGRQEGFGLVAVEAMACGIPLVVTSAAGVSQMVQRHGAGSVVPPGNINALANAIDELLTRPSLAEQLRKQGRKVAETQFSWVAIARQYEAIYQDARAAS